MSATFLDFTQILNFEIEHLTASSDISDMAIGSVARSFLEAVALQIDEAYFQLIQLLNSFYISTASGSDLDRRASDFGLQRQLALNATTTVIFTGSGTPIIPAGTIVLAPAGSNPEVDFVTTFVGTVGDAIPVIALNAGSSGNVTSGAITGIQNNPNPLLITGVTNGGPSVGGQDTEQDSTFRARIQKYLLSLSKGTVNSIISACLNIPNTGITQVQVLESFMLDFNGGADNTTQDLNEDNPSTNAADLDPTALPGTNPGNITVVIDNGSGAMPFSATLSALDVINGDVTDPLNFPGYRAAGIQAFVTRPYVIPVDIEVNIYVTSDVIDSSIVINDCKVALGAYIQRLPIGGKIYLSEIIDNVMNIDGVLDAPLDGISTPASDVSGEPATKYTAGTITINVLN